MDKKVRSFLHAFRGTFTSRQYYRKDVLKAPFSFSLKFFLVFFIIYAFLFTFYLSTKAGQLGLGPQFKDIEAVLKEVNPTVLFFGAVVALPLAELLYLLFFAAISWVVVRLLKVKVGFVKRYQLGLHLVIVATVVWSVLAVFGIIINLPFARILFLLALTALIFWKKK